MDAGHDRAEQGGVTSDDLARAFQQERARLLRVAYATLGSVAEAEDCVQEAWLRLRMLEDPSGIRDLRLGQPGADVALAPRPGAAERVQRQPPDGPDQPAPQVAETGADPAERVTLDESVSMALLLVLESLSPAERAAFLLHDVFSMTFEEVAEVVGRTPAAVRQLASRARRHVAAGRPRFPPTPQEQRALVEAFAAACQGGDLDALTRLLDPDVVCRGDGGGKVSAVPGEVLGADQVARLLLSFTRGARLDVRVATVNGMPGLVLRAVDDVLSVASFTVDGGRITSVDVIRNPDKLAYVSVPD